MRIILGITVVAVILVSVSCRKDHTADLNPSAAPQSTVTVQSNSAAAPSVQAIDKPALSCQVETLSLYPVPNNPANLAISVVVSVQNSGAASTLQDWKLTVYSPNRSDFTAFEAVHVNGVVEMPGAGGRRVDLAKEDLALASKQVPVEKAGQLRGVLTFVLPKTSVQELSNNQSSFVIHFKDSQGTLYRSRKTVIGLGAK